MHMRPVLKAIKELVVMAHGMNLGLYMTQLINRLHLRGNPRTNTTELTADMGITLIGLIF